MNKKKILILYNNKYNGETARSHQHKGMKEIVKRMDKRRTLL